MGIPRTLIEPGDASPEIQIHVETGRARGSLNVALAIPEPAGDALAAALRDLHDPRGASDLDTRLGRMAGQAPEGFAFLVGLEDQAWVLPSSRVQIRRERDGETEDLHEPQVIRLRPGDVVTLADRGSGVPLARTRVVDAPSPVTLIVDDPPVLTSRKAPGHTLPPARTPAPRRLSRRASIVAATILVALAVVGAQLFGPREDPTARAYVAPSLEQRVVSLLTLGSSSVSNDKAEETPNGADADGADANGAGPDGADPNGIDSNGANPAPGATAGTEPGGESTSAAVAGLPWEFRTDGAITSSPLLVKDRVVFGCRDQHLYCLDAVSGAPVWTVPTASGIGSSPRMAGDLVVVGTYGGKLIAVNLRSGKVAWETTLGSRVVSSPCIVKDRIIVGAYDGKVHAVSATDGTPKWAVDTGAAVRASAEQVGDAIAIGSGNGRFVVVDARDGALRWEKTYADAVHAQAAWDPDSGRLWVATQGGLVECLDGPSGKLLWSATLPSEVNARPVLAGNRLIVGTGQGTLHALRPESGQEVWNAKADRGFDACPIVLGGVVLAPSFDGTLHRIALENGRPLESRTVGSEVFSSPAASGDHLYLGTMGGTFLALALP
jgi:outer membrane protein assembly factor BamB